MKLFTLIGIIALSLQMSFGQDTNRVFSYGGDKDDVGVRAIPFRSGFLLIGRTASFGYVPVDLYLVHVDSTYQTIRSTTIGEHQIEVVTDAEVRNDSVFVLGYANSNDQGDYRGKIWVLDSNLTLVTQIDIDLGTYTMPKELLLTGDRLFVAGEIGLGSTSFLKAFDLSLNETAGRLFEGDNFRRYTHLEAGLGSGFYASAVHPETGTDSSGTIYSYSFDLLTLDSIQLTQVEGRVNYMTWSASNDLLWTGTRIDESINGNVPMFTLGKVNAALDSVYWSSTFVYVDSGTFSSGQRILELDNGELLVIANTDYLSFSGGLAIIATEFDSLGSILTGQGSIYGWVEDEIARDAFLTDGQTAVIFGTSASYGGGGNDYYLLEIPVRSESYVYVVNEYIDTLQSTVEIRELPNSTSASTCINQRSYLSDCECELTLSNLLGQVLFTGPACHLSSLDVKDGVYVIRKANEARKVFLRTY